MHKSNKECALDVIDDQIYNENYDKNPNPYRLVALDQIKNAIQNNKLSDLACYKLANIKYRDFMDLIDAEAASYRNVADATPDRDLYDYLKLMLYS